MEPKEIEKTAELLRQLKPGFLPYPIFEQIARLVALPILEIVPLRKNDAGRIEVLLIRRDENDSLWPGTVHTPGTVIRATDMHVEGEQNWQALERILKDELHGTPVGPLNYVGSMLHESKRGVEQAQLYWVEIAGEPHTGTFYTVDDLPDNLIESQTDFIALAVEQYRKTLPD